MADGFKIFRGAHIDVLPGAEFLKYVPLLVNGFGFGTGTVAEGWIEDAIAFWGKNME